MSFGVGRSLTGEIVVAFLVNHLAERHPFLGFLGLASEDLAVTDVGRGRIALLLLPLQMGEVVDLAIVQHALPFATEGRQRGYRLVPFFLQGGSEMGNAL